MAIEVKAPSTLPLGLARLEGTTAVLGIALQYIHVQLTARERADTLSITGARAQVAHEYAMRFFDHHQREPRGEVEIEWAIPTLMGLGSDPLLGLSAAEGLAQLYGLPTVAQDALGMARALGLGPEQALNLWGFQQGGLMLVDTVAANDAAVPSLLRRHPIPYADRDRAWVFVVFLPRVSPEIPAAYETERQQAMLRTATHVGPDSGRVFADELWPAVERDDLPTFARALRSLQQLTEEALAQAGTPNVVGASAQAVLQVMQDNGALAWGQSLTGFALYGLVQSQEAARQLKLKILAHSGHFGGTELAAVADNSGVRCSRS